MAKQETTIDELNQICAAAKAAESALRKFSSADRAEFLIKIADALVARRDSIVPLAMEESNLPEARLNGELDRTAFQFRNFANEVSREKQVVTTDALPDRTPLPRPKIELIHVPIGTIAVFGASNFPLAFSVAGGDTASALAAGCPVVVMAHPAHPRLSEMVAEIIRGVVQECGLPDATFTCVYGGPSVGQALVNHSAVKGVGFTGSQRVGRILMDLAAQRPEPIAVFAEMGSINPVFMLPEALNSRGEALSSGYAASLTMGVGQFCTNPGVVYGVKSEAWSNFVSGLVEQLGGIATGKMLTQGIGENYLKTALTVSSSAEVLVEVTAAGAPGLARVSASEFRENHLLQEEVFGPFGLLVECETIEELLASVTSAGQLTATIQWAEGDESVLYQLVPKLEAVVGRLVFNGYPTGVEVCEAMQHGGPYPASSDSRYTSVGNGAIKRWLRPVAYQNKPEGLVLV
jgi:2,5-dioxopentanoate dehydrogenase